MSEQEREPNPLETDERVLDGTTAAPKQSEAQDDESPAETDMRQAYESTPAAKVTGPARPRKQRG